MVKACSHLLANVTVVHGRVLKCLIIVHAATASPVPLVTITVSVQHSTSVEQDALSPSRGRIILRFQLLSLTGVACDLLSPLQVWEKESSCPRCDCECM